MGTVLLPSGKTGLFAKKKLVQELDKINREKRNKKILKEKLKRLEKSFSENKLVLGKNCLIFINQKRYWVFWLYFFINIIFLFYIGLLKLLKMI